MPTTAQLEKAQAIINYQFNDPSILEEALRHSSSVSNRQQSNERMEFLGDAILGYTVCEYLYEKYPDELEGEMTKIKSAVVSRRVCHIIARDLQFDQILELGKGMTERQALPSSILAAAFESIIAAIYLDGGMAPAKEFILNHLIPFIKENSQSAHQQNFKSILQQYTQRHLSATPQYHILNESGPDHDKIFEICAQVNGKKYSPAQGKTKKQSEQNAALNALKALGLATQDEAGKVVLEDV